MIGAPLPLPPAGIPQAERPLVVQSDGTLLLDVGGTWAAPARDALSSFAHLERSPEYVHTPSDAAGILQLREALAGRQASLPACR